MLDPTLRRQAIRSMTAACVTSESQMRKQREAFVRATRSMQRFRLVWDRTHSR